MKFIDTPVVKNLIQGSLMIGGGLLLFLMAVEFFATIVVTSEGMIQSATEGMQPPVPW